MYLNSLKYTINDDRVSFSRRPSEKSFELNIMSKLDVYQRGCTNANSICIDTDDIKCCNIDFCNDSPTNRLYNNNILIILSIIFHKLVIMI
jgi:hypothetical protein